MGIWKKYNLSLVLCVLFLSSLLLQGWFGWAEFINEEKDHGKVASLNDYSSSFFRATFENWQSEFLQLFTFVVLASFLIHKGSPQSKDGDDEMRAQLARIEKLLVSRKKN